MPATLRSRILRATSLTLGLVTGEAAWAGDPPSSSEPPSEREIEVDAELDTAVYVRSDSDHTTVVSPRIHFRTAFEHRGGTTSIDLVSATDVWTSASVDIRTAASERVTEVRDEIVVGVDHVRETWTLGLAARLSSEPDFLARGVTFASTWEGFSRNVRLDARVGLELDRVGRSGDAGFARPLYAVTSAFSYTQVLARATLLQLAFEQRGSFGMHASPYRYVGLGGASDCSNATLCVPEVHPDRRGRFALALRARQGLHRRVSLGADYRYYVDTWAIQSHTLGADLRVRAGEALVMALEYRAYLQSGAWFYRSNYALHPPGGFATRDRELSSMYDHRVSVVLDASRRVRRVTLATGLLLGLGIYGYDDFLGLDRVLAGEGSWVGRIAF